MFRRSDLLRPKIATKLVVSFLLIAIIPLAVVSTLAYINAKQQLTQSVTSGLSATAENKASQIERYLSERKKEVSTLSHTPTLIDAMDRFSRAFEKMGILTLDYGQDYQDIDQQVRPFLTYYQETVGFADLFLISPKGDLVFSLNRGEDLGSNYKTGVYQDSGLALVFDRATTLLETEVSDFEYYSATNEPAAFIASPITKEGVVIGVVALQLNNKEVYRLVSEYIGLGETGETLIGSAIGKKVVFVAPVRHDPYAALRREVAMGSLLDIPLQEATQGKKGNGTYLDYRGKEVLAVWRYLPSFRWGMVVKIDTDEVFSPIHGLRNLSLAIGSIAALLVISLSRVFSRTLSDPIVKLTQATRLIAAGDLTHRADTTATDEIGELAESFNTMAVRIEERTVTLAEANEALRLSHVRLEERVAERTDELAASNAELEAFSYSVSHDLRAPLRAIGGFAAILTEDHAGQMNEDARHCLDVIRTNIKQMDQLINDLLGFSRLGRQPMTVSPVNMDELARFVAEELKQSEPTRNIQVEIRPLPDALGDRVLLHQVFVNLLSNAIKYTRTKPVAIIEVGCDTEGEQNRYYVKDNGAGFDMRFVDKLFGVFQRLHSAEEFEGTGVGLALVQRLIHRHGGRIWGEGKVGEGAIFYFTLPKGDNGGQGE